MNPYIIWKKEEKKAMKKFYVNERFFAIGDKFDILDENGDVAYFAKSALFTFGRQYTIYDRKGSEVSYIRQRLLHFLPNYDLEINGRTVATVQKEFSLFVKKYIILSEFGNFTVDGDIFAWDFEIRKDNDTVCHVSKELMTFRDRYEVMVQDDFDEVFAISLVIILDAVHHEKRR
jgi:uncharacterized protein YxjI